MQVSSVLALHGTVTVDNIANSCRGYVLEEALSHPSSCHENNNIRYSRSHSHDEQSRCRARLVCPSCLDIVPYLALAVQEHLCLTALKSSSFASTSRHGACSDASPGHMSADAVEHNLQGKHELVTRRGGAPSCMVHVLAQ